jgi:hypothetical protein
VEEDLLHELLHQLRRRRQSCLLGWWSVRAEMQNRSTGGFCGLPGPFKPATTAVQPSAERLVHALSSTSVKMLTSLL